MTSLETVFATIGALDGRAMVQITCWLDNAADVTFVLSIKNLLKAALKQASGCLPIARPSFVDVDQAYKVLKNN